MYLIGTHIPIYTDGDRNFLEDSWYSDVALARRYFAPHFGEIKLIGPSLPCELAECERMQEITADMDGLSVHPSIDKRTQIRAFWPTAFRQWQRDLAPLLEEASVVHASIDDPFRPMQLATMRSAIRAKKATVLIGFDMDLWELFGVQMKQLGNSDRALHVCRTLGMDFWMRYCVKQASVSMLKEGLVYDRYSKGAKNPKSFCHSMHSSEHIISEKSLEDRLSRIRSGRPLRFVYFGRFVKRKGLVNAIRILASARTMGVDASYDLVGEGEQQVELEALARELGISQHVNFPGTFPYGTKLHEKLNDYDALLFTPTEEDTPRMVYDAYASGLPLITSDIAFLRHRANKDHASILFGVGDIAEGAKKIAELDKNREKLISLSLASQAAGVRHSVESWYEKRLDWTIEALECHRQSV
ncbi:glycosyltransferase [Gammaproteobacteria bacterium]|nr:glycosyltransferase [Gammaproteobacteria bacterium]